MTQFILSLIIGTLITYTSLRLIGWSIKATMQNKQTKLITAIIVGLCSAAIGYSCITFVKLLFECIINI